MYESGSYFSVLVLLLLPDICCCFTTLYESFEDYRRCIRYLTNKNSLGSDVVRMS